MKKNGFTLAEVLITLAVIGIVAAITLPSLTTGHTYKTLGVDLAKIFSTTEGASRAYVISNAQFRVPSEQAAVAAFANDVFVFKTDTFLTAKSIDTGNTYTEANLKFNKLKDGTEIAFTQYKKVDPAHATSINRTKYGDAAFGFVFRPNVKGLPSSVQSTYHFIMTENGYIYPGNDACLWSLYENDWNTRASQFTNIKDESGKDNACYASYIGKNGEADLLDSKSQTSSDSETDPETL